MDDDDDDDGPERLKCGQKVELNPDGKPATGSGTGSTPQAARTCANSAAQQAALRAALDAAKEYACPEECPGLRFSLHLSRPDADKPTPNGAGGFFTNSSCDWTCTLSCRRALAPGGAVECQEQELLCSDPWTIVAEANASGAPEKGKQPDVLGWIQLAAKLLKNLSVALTDELSSVVHLVRCPPARCPNKVLRIYVWPAKIATAGPDANGDFTWTPTQWYRVEARCQAD